MPFTEYAVLHHSLAELHLSCFFLHCILCCLFYLFHFIQQYLENFIHFIFEEFIFQVFSSCSQSLPSFLLTPLPLCLLFQCAFMCEAIFCVFACLAVFMCVYLYICICACVSMCLCFMSVFRVRVSYSSICFSFVSCIIYGIHISLFIYIVSTH